MIAVSFCVLVANLRHVWLAYASKILNYIAGTGESILFTSLSTKIVLIIFFVVSIYTLCLAAYVYFLVTCSIEISTEVVSSSRPVFVVCSVFIITTSQQLKKVSERANVSSFSVSGEPLGLGNIVCLHESYSTR